MPTRLFAFLFVSLAACFWWMPEAFAHASDEHAGSARLRWNADPWIIGSMLLSAGLYGHGLSRLWRNAGRGAGVALWRAACFAGGMLSLAAALLSPIDTLGVELFSMHMVQHELLMLVAAPLLVCGQPLVVFLWGFPLHTRKQIARYVRSRSLQVPWQFLMQPLVAWLLHAIVLWGWHFPSLFQAGLRSDAVHTLQHSSFLISALLFWASLIGTQFRVRTGAAAIYILTTVIHTGMLGALLTFSTRIWYPMYAGRTEVWGLSVLEDQQLGGLIMWVPAGFILLVAGLIVAARLIAPDTSDGRGVIAMRPVKDER